MTRFLTKRVRILHLSKSTFPIKVQLTSVPSNFNRLRSFGVKPILDYSVEEDLSQEEAEEREVKASVSMMGDSLDAGSLPQYHVDKSFADRRYKVQSARTYFYLNEATCERNMETFIRVILMIFSFLHRN